jgi:hypothetical protein
MVEKEKEELSRKRAAAGRRGGLATLAKHGLEHFREIGKKGARAFWLKYELLPVGLSQFAIVRRDSCEIVAYLDGKPF